MWMPKIESCGRKNDRCDHKIAPCVREKDIRDHKIAHCVREKDIRAHNTMPSAHKIAPCVREKDIRDHKIAPCGRAIEACRRYNVCPSDFDVWRRRRSVLRRGRSACDADG
jgi:hypothetical protein